jgi:streptomycin 6-kinase
MIEIPASYRQFMHDVFGEEGTAWVAALPALVGEYAERWSLVEIGRPFALSYNYVAPVVRADGSEAVLKVSSPHGDHYGEIDALRLYDGVGVNRLLEVDREPGVLLLERLRPGTMLAELPDDEEATAIAAGLLQTLWRPAPPNHNFPTVAGWFQAFDRHRAHFDGPGPLDAGLFDAATAIVTELLAEQQPPMLLHGDFHHHNILSAERAPWLIIDPKGLVGDPGYELGAFLYNPIDLHERYPDLARVLRRRVDQLSELLGFDRARVRRWGIAQAVLSAVWSCEGEGYGWEGVMAVADSLLYR